MVFTSDVCGAFPTPCTSLPTHSGETGGWNELRVLVHINEITFTRGQSF